MVEISVKDKSRLLNWVLYIYYLIWFKNNKVWALINFNNKVNAMTLRYALKVGLKFALLILELKKLLALILTHFK